MEQVIIGSTAIKHYFPDFNREPKDIDYAVASMRGRKTSREVEYLLNPVILKYADSEILSPELLLALKMSHLRWDINWDKHMYDTQFLLAKGVTYSTDVLADLIVYWEGYHPTSKRSDLTLNKEDFFDNAINRNIDHDLVHTFIAEVPAYTKVLKDGCDVEPDPYKFCSLSHEEKMDVISEEVMVMAWERFPNIYYKKAYHRMLKKYIISHVPEFAYEFAIKNYIDLKPKFDFKKLIDEKFDNRNHGQS